jgi:PKD repeat protein
MVTNSVGTTFIAFTQEDPVNLGREILLADNYGGLFARAPIDISRSPGDDYGPKIYLDPQGKPHLVWARRLGNDPQVVYCPPEGEGQGVPVVVAEGDSPALAIDDGGVAYIVFSRDRDLFVANDRDGSFGAESRVTTTPQPQDEEFFPSIAVSGTQSVFVAYERKGGLYYHQSLDGGLEFGPPRLLDSGGITKPELKVTGKYLSIVYEKGGDLVYILGKVGSALANPVRVFDAPDTIESSPSLALDPAGNVHLSFIREGEVYYTTNADALSAEFVGAPLTGQAPLEVHFTDLSSGPVQIRHWDFGDGSPVVSSGREIDHAYTTPGKYTVTLEIFGIAEDSMRLEKKDFVLVQTPDNSLAIPDNRIFPGQKDIWFPLVAAHKQPLQGFQAAGTFDASVLTLKGITWEGTALDNLKEVEFYIPYFDDEPGKEYFYVGVLIDYINAPHYDETIPVSKAQRLTHLIFDCAADAPLGGTTVVDLKNGVGPKSSNNIFVIGEGGPIPSIRSSVCAITDEGQEVFLRGDVDGSKEVDISDAVKLLAFLYLGGKQPRCMDAGDTNDSGAVDISDPISILTFLFLGGVSPALPFPLPGLDPSPDDLEACGS